VILPPKPLVRDNSKETRQRTQAIAQLEERIRQQESTIQRLSGELQNAGQVQAFENMHRLSWQIAQSQAALDKLVAEWEKVAV
jgi:TolA-binding protein